MESFNIAAIPNVDSESTIGCLKRFLFMIKNENKLKVNRKKYIYSSNRHWSKFQNNDVLLLFKKRLQFLKVLQLLFRNI